VRYRRIEIRDESRWSDYYCNLTLTDDDTSIALVVTLRNRDRLQQRGAANAIHFDHPKFPEYAIRFGELHCRRMPEIAAQIDTTLAKLLDRPPPCSIGGFDYERHWRPAARTILPTVVRARQTIDRATCPSVGINDIVDGLLQNRTPSTTAFACRPTTKVPKTSLAERRPCLRAFWCVPATS
jgi:hypothetical protein